tara:strand:- start:5530 stop:6600 length:1071 start_codon:yes stop_codon:yes gene_type:complete
LAKRFAITDRGLAKKCDYHNIPRPPQGHWVRLECGHAVEKTPLPAVGDGTEESIYLYPATESEEKASETPCLLTEEQLAHAMEFRIPERVGRYNDNVRACRNDYRSSKVLDKYGRIIFDRDIANPGFKVTPKTFDRASLFLHGLLKLCQDLGWKLVAEKNWRGSEKVLAVSHSGETLHFQLKEPVKQIDHKGEDRDSYWGPKYDYVPLGTLELSIEGLYSSGIRTRWKDKRDVMLEDQLLSVVQSLSRGFEYERLETIERDRQHREWEIEEARRKEAQRLQKIEEKRREHLLALTENHRQAEAIRSLVSAMKMPVDGDGEWKEWAKAVADEIDPVTSSGEVLERHQSIGEQHFYGW